MKPLYQPTPEELEMAELEHVMRRNRNDITNQEGLVASLVHDIYNFDYYYQYSDDGAVWRNAEKRKQDIEDRLINVEDAILRDQLERCFFVTKREQVLELVSWGKHFHKATDYVYFRWDGADDEKARQLIGLRAHIKDIVEQVDAEHISHRVIYANDIERAGVLLREGISWKQDILHPVAVSVKLYATIERFVDRYQRGIITYADLKTAYRVRVDCIVLRGNDGGTVEIIRVCNFYFMIIKN